MTINDVAKALGKSPETIRMGLQLGVYPFGSAFKRPGKKRWNYTLYPEIVKQYIGVSDEEVQT